MMDVIEVAADKQVHKVGDEVTREVATNQNKVAALLDYVPEA